MELYSDRITMGRGVFLDSGTVFTSKPLMLKIENGRRRRVTATGRLVIEDDVEIGANCVLNFGVDGDTVIHSGVFIGHLCCVGHDSEIGEHTVLGSQTTLGGHVKIGKWSFIGMGTTIRPQVTIGNYTMIGMGSIVVNDIESGVIAYGNPCKVIRKNEWRPDE